MVTRREGAIPAKLLFRSFRDRDMERQDISSQGMLKCKNTEIPKCEMAKSMRDPVLVIQWCWILRNLIEGLLLLFMINCSIVIQLSEPNHGSWTIGVSVAEALFYGFEG